MHACCQTLPLCEGAGPQTTKLVWHIGTAMRGKVSEHIEEIVSHRKEVVEFRQVWDPGGHEHTVRVQDRTCRPDCATTARL